LVPYRLERPWLNIDIFSLSLRNTLPRNPQDEDMNGKGITMHDAVGLTVPGTAFAPGLDMYCIPIEVTSHTYCGFDLTDNSGSATASYPEPHPDMPDDRNGPEGHSLPGGLPFIVSYARARLRDSDKTCAVGRSITTHGRDNIMGPGNLAETSGETDSLVSPSGYS